MRNVAVTREFMAPESNHQEMHLLIRCTKEQPNGISDKRIKERNLLLGQVVSGIRTVKQSLASTQIAPSFGSCVISASVNYTIGVFLYVSIIAWQ